MPELPEVETIKRDLETKVIGLCFTGATLSWPRMLQNMTPDAFRRRLVSQCIEGLKRRGKYLIFKLSTGDALILHMRMSGSLRLDDDSYSDPYVRAVFDFDSGAKLYFRDPRKFGMIWLVEDEEQVVGKLGPEPLDTCFTARTLRSILSKHSAPTKAIICDQTVIAGIGNMYADEALFDARIHPERKSSSLSRDEIKRLHRAIITVLTQAIDNGGASISDYTRPDGKSGEAQFVFKVAHQLGGKCKSCGTQIERIPIRKRGSYFCPKCQGKNI
ncbi:MAG: bifunctional DNA-formamidopyrimidine glycosylase/DNA-(apurinic or apyrimidinic site) lyase [Dehalococcoidia bacterium]